MGLPPPKSMKYYLPCLLREPSIGRKNDRKKVDQEEEEEVEDGRGSSSRGGDSQVKLSYSSVRMGNISYESERKTKSSVSLERRLRAIEAQAEEGEERRQVEVFVQGMKSLSPL